MVMDDCLRRSIFRKSKLVCHNRLRWEQIIVKKNTFLHSLHRSRGFVLSV